jgi:hypothetical protein
MDYFAFKALRAAANTPFKETVLPSPDQPIIIELETFAFNMTYKARIDLKRTDANNALLDLAAITDYLGPGQTLGAAEGYQQFANKPVEKEEFRFVDVMDLTKKWTWDCRTHGFRAQRPAGAQTYDDVRYRWLDGQGQVVAYLYMPDGKDKPGYWKLGDGTNPAGDADWIKYFPNDVNNPQDPDGDWKVVATDTVCTSSLVVIEPYAGYKIEFAQVKIKADETAVLASPLHFRIFSVLTPEKAQELGLDEPGPGYYDGYYVIEGVPTFLPAWAAQAMGVPQPAGGWYTGIYTVKDWVYRTVDDFQSLVNYTDNDGSWVFDYDKTMRSPIDSMYLQRVEVELETPERVTGSVLARSTFIGMKIRSF